MVELVSRTTQFYPPSLEQKIFPELLDIVCQRFFVPSWHGEGGMGIIIGEEENPVEVMKIIQLDLLDHPQIHDWFEQEYQLLQYLSHIPGVVQVSDPIVKDGKFYGYCMEYLSYPGLLFVSEATTFDAVQIFFNLAVILQHINSLGVFHRNLSPANILVDLDSPDLAVKLIDFGVSYAERHDMRLLDKEIYVGHSDLAAPEVTLKMIYADSQSEIFAFGSTFYEFLTDQSFLHYVQSKGFANTQEFFLSEEEIDVSMIDPLFQPIIQKCMAYSLSYHSDGRTCIDRSERYNNFMEVAADLMDLKKHFCQLTESDLYRHYICD